MKIYKCGLQGAVHAGASNLEVINQHSNRCGSHGTRRKRLGTNADRARVPELGLAIFQLLDTEKTGRAQQRRLKRRSHGGRKRIRGIKVLKTFFKERMID